MSDRPRFGKEEARWKLNRQMRLAVANRHVFRYLVAATALIAVGTGFIAHLVDRADFPTFGVGIWWSIVTLGTVGYGDVVPHTAWGRVLGGVVIIFGVTFISFLIAIVTSLFVDADRERLEEARAAREAATEALLHSIELRLAEIEKSLSTPPGTHRP